VNEGVGHEEFAVLERMAVAGDGQLFLSQSGHRRNAALPGQTEWLR
jgi:hypothetical protein